jgi:hypothetical protein
VRRGRHSVAIFRRACGRDPHTYRNVRSDTHADDRTNRYALADSNADNRADERTDGGADKSQFVPHASGCERIDAVSARRSTHVDPDAVKSNLFASVKASTAGVRENGSQETCERVASFLEGLALDLRELALTRPSGPQEREPLDARYAEREERIRKLLAIDPKMTPDLVCRIVGGQRQQILVILRAVRIELGISTKRRVATKVA